MLIVSKGVSVDFDYKVLGAVSFFKTYYGGIISESGNTAISALTKQAEELGGDAVIGIKFSLSSAADTGGLYVSVIAVGTAVKRNRI